MRIRVEGFDLPGRSCGPSPQRPGGHDNIHVAVQGRRGPDDVRGLVAGDAASAVWELEVTVVKPPPSADVRGPEVHGRPGERWIYLTWGTVSDLGEFRMFKRGKVMVADVPDDVMAAACSSGVLVGRLALTNERGQPGCGRPVWSAPPSG
ncbi:MAG: monooxygenase [Mycobacterium sp.]|nr:monooxygenase [Mycobacterium sp.]